MHFFMARQQIFDRRQIVYGYELLFRSGPENRCVLNDLNQSYASSKTIVDSWLFLGMDNIAGDKRAFINVTRENLVGEHLHLLPKDKVVVEILEDVEPDEATIAACRELKAAGYLIALDDFKYEARLEPLLALADIVKIDFLTLSPQERLSLRERFLPRGIKLLAEKIETHEAFREAYESGYSYFQGYYFSHPTMISGKDVASNSIAHLNLLREINRPELDLERLSQCIKSDLSLSYKLLRYINSASFGCRREIKSISQALLLLGEKEVRRWASLILLAMIGKGKPEELIVLAALRAKFCELVVSDTAMSYQAQDLYLLGMFSLLDAILDRPFSTILRDIPIAEDVKIALTGGENHFRDVYDCVLAYERADWERVSKLTAKLDKDETQIPAHYLEAVNWVNSNINVKSMTA